MRPSLVSLMFLTLVAACGSDPATPNPVCTAGATTVCACAGGSSGAQTCNGAGSGFGVCECGSPMDGGMLDSGPGPVCTAGTSQACMCTGGGTGTQACNSAGSGYGACSCSPTTCTVTQVGTEFTDSCASNEICVCPLAASECTDGVCGGIDGRMFSFAFRDYVAPMLDFGGNCYDDFLTPCDDPPDMLVDATVSGVAFGPITATDTPTLSGAVWFGTFGDTWYATVGMDRSYAFTWVDFDSGDPNDPIGVAVGTLTDATLRGRYLAVGSVGNGFDLYIIPE